jgi:hypothetical protein
MMANQLKQIQEELTKLKSQNVISINDKYRIQKLQQTLDSIFDEE